MEPFFGGSPAAVILKLVIASIIIGVVLSFLGYNPRDLSTAISRLLNWISTLGWDAVISVGRYLALGAIIVVPVWLLTRVLGLLGSSRGDRR